MEGAETGASGADWMAEEDGAELRGAEDHELAAGAAGDD